MIIVQSLTNQFGEQFIAANVVIMRVDGFAMMPNFSFGTALTTYAGQNVGAGLYDRVTKGAKQGLAMAVGCSAGITVLILFFGKHLMHLFTDTTERSPTFMLPGFKRIGDTELPEPWAFVRNPLYSANEAMRRALDNRELRCLEWTKEDYISMGAPEKIVNAPPQISAENLLQIPVGNIDLPERYASGYDAAVLFYFNDASSELRRAAKSEAEKTALKKY
jgi:hypothetical protein